MHRPRSTTGQRGPRPLRSSFQGSGASLVGAAGAEAQTHGKVPLFGQGREAAKVPHKRPDHPQHEAGRVQGVQDEAPDVSLRTGLTARRGRQRCGSIRTGATRGRRRLRRGPIRRKPGKKLSALEKEFNRLHSKIRVYVDTIRRVDLADNGRGYRNPLRPD